jgi:hypothetical protein
VRGGLLLAVTAALVTLLGAEVGLRVIWSKPLGELEAARAAPDFTQPDSELGWINRPGSYKFFAHGSRVAAGVTNSSDGARGRTVVTPTIAAFGCSITFGWGVGDAAPYPTLLGRLLHEPVANYGVPGYDTLQSFLLWRRHAARPDFHPSLVLYGFFEHHMQRNVAAVPWVHLLVEAAHDPAAVQVPFATVDAAGQLQLDGMFHYPQWFLHGTSALVTLAQFAYALHGHRAVAAQAEPVTVALLQHFRDEVESRGSRFIVVLLDRPNEVLDRVHKAAAVPMMECSHPVYPSTDTQISATDGHPRTSVHRFWAHCIARYLRRERELASFRAIHAPADDPGRGESDGPLQTWMRSR